MTARRPLVAIAGLPTELPVGDLLDSTTVPAASVGLFDGGNATTTYVGVAKIDCGGAT